MNLMLEMLRKRNQDVLQADKDFLRHVALIIGGSDVHLKYENHGYHNQYTITVVEVRPPTADNLFDLKDVMGPVFRVWEQTEITIA